MLLKIFLITAIPVPLGEESRKRSYWKSLFFAPVVQTIHLFFVLLNNFYLFQYKKEMSSCQT